MLKFVVFVIAVLAGSTLLALNAERIMLFHFDANRVSPEAAGEPRLREETRHGLVLWVANPKPGKPTLLYFHGNAGNLAGRVSRFSKLITQGYGVVAVAYPGSSGSEGAQTSDNFNRLAILVYNSVPELVGKNGIIVYGESIGTGVATHLLAEGLTDETPPIALILEAPYTSVLDLGRLRYPALGPYLHRLGDPWISRDNITKISVPLLILHGSEDRVIPPTMGQELFALSPARDKTFYLAQGVGHTVSWQGQAQAVLFRFLARF